jgi:hypothetical protein
MSENLGAFSLIRRGYREIIISDHASDSDGRFKDLCDLRRVLRLRRLHLYVPALEDFVAHCAQVSKKASSYDLWNWKNQVLLGCVTQDETNTECRPDRGYFAKLFIMKPALPKALVDAAQGCSRDTCAAAFKELRKNPQFRRVSAELFGYLFANAKQRASGMFREHLVFPQDSTFWMTLNTSPFQFGAYRELAFWQMQFLPKTRLCWQLHDLEACQKPQALERRISN